MLELHALNDDDYYLGIFLVGAYQEILGDLHNLFGDTHAVQVSLAPERRLPDRPRGRGRHGDRGAQLRAATTRTTWSRSCAGSPRRRCAPGQHHPRRVAPAAAHLRGRAWPATRTWSARSTRSSPRPARPAAPGGPPEPENGAARTPSALPGPESPESPASRPGTGAVAGLDGRALVNAGPSPQAQLLQRPQLPVVRAHEAAKSKLARERSFARQPPQARHMDSPPLGAQAEPLQLPKPAQRRVAQPGAVELQPRQLLRQPGRPPSA